MIFFLLVAIISFEALSWSWWSAGSRRCGETENHFIRIYSGENCKWENNLWKLLLRRGAHHVKMEFLCIFNVNYFACVSLWRLTLALKMRQMDACKRVCLFVCLLLFMLILYDACMMCMHSHLIRKPINTAVVRRIETNQRFDGWMEVSAHLKSIKYNQ